MANKHWIDKQKRDDRRVFAALNLAAEKLERAGFLDCIEREDAVCLTAMVEAVRIMRDKYHAPAAK